MLPLLLRQEPATTSVEFTSSADLICTAYPASLTMAKTPLTWHSMICSVTIKEYSGKMEIWVRKEVVLTEVMVSCASELRSICPAVRNAALGLVAMARCATALMVDVKMDLHIEPQFSCVLVC